MKNKLENWISNSGSNEVKIMNLLQEYGVVSDNAISANQVGNDMEAMKWMACNHRLIKNENFKSLD